jgi:hypothetical protein
MRRRLQVLGDDPAVHALDHLENEDGWMTYFIERLERLIRNFGRRFSP